MKKKYLCLLLVLTMIASLFAGCGGNSDDSAKDNTTTEPTTENAVVIPSTYSEKIEIPTQGNKKVTAHYNPDAIDCYAFDESSVELGSMMSVYTTHTATPDDFMNYITSEMGGEIGKHEEATLSGYKVHYYTVVEPGTGVFYDKMFLIELDTDVVVHFRTQGSMEKGSQLEKDLAAIYFVVE